MVRPGVARSFVLPSEAACVNVSGLSRASCCCSQAMRRCAHIVPNKWYEHKELDFLTGHTMRRPTFRHQSWTSQFNERDAHAESDARRTRIPKEGGQHSGDCGRRCIHLIAELGLTSNQSAAARRAAPDSTASTTRSRNSKEHGFGIDPPSKIRINAASVDHQSPPGNPDLTQPKSALESKDH